MADDRPTEGGEREALAAVLHEHYCTAYKHEGRNGPCEQQARTILASDWLRDHDAAVRAEARREAGEEIAAAIEAERPEIGTQAYPNLGAPGALDAFRRASDLNDASFIARHTSGARLGKRYDEPGAVEDTLRALARQRQRHADTAAAARTPGGDR